MVKLLTQLLALIAQLTSDLRQMLLAITIYREDIIRMAREAGISKPWDQEPVKWETLERFAALVAAAEREACAVIAFNAKTYVEAANAIRARGRE